ncbi:hypothetical protein HK099_007899 [Clydaea vesicula]|uniref:Uncharacterized protein n=1 Tax=Clydaea vesicula TaxID=447962 RepID=A0AAD5U523_9FUNG|nr:hypothetical protein HK099_007899 [Clydaea vesicula]
MQIFFFGLKIQISVGENMITGVATGTSIFVKALPLPPSLKVLRNIDVVDEEDVKLLEVQKKIQIQSEQNRMKIESALNEKDIIENVEALFVSKKDTEAGSESIMQQNSDEVAPSRSDFPKKKSTTVGQSSQIDGVEAITDVLSEDGSSGESSSESEFDELMKSASNSLRHRLVVVQIDDEQDEDLVLLLDPTFPVGFQLLNLEPTANLIFNSEEQKKTGSQQNFTERSQSKLQLITLVKQGLIHLQHHPNRQLAEIFKTMYKEIQLQLSYFSPCIVAGIEYSIKLPQENEVQITMIAACIGQSLPLNDLEPEYQEDDSVNLFKLENLTDRSGYDSPKSSKHGSASLNESFKFRFSKFQAKPSALNVSKVPTPIDEKFKSPSVSEEDFNPIQENDEEYNSKSLNVSSRFHTSQSEGIDLENGNSRSNISNPRENTVTDTGVRNSNMPNNNIPFVELTPLKSVQNRRILKFLGRLSLHFVKEANIVFETGLGLSGMGGFTHEFWCEVYSVLRAHTAAQGGNCLIGLTIDQNIFSESIKNQGYALLSCSGDVVFCDPDSAYETFEEEDMGKGFGEKLFGEVIDFNILGGNNIESSQWLKASRIGLDFFGRLSETTSTRNSALSLN